MTNARYINPDAISKPTGYTHVVETTGGKTVYISGQVALNAAGEVVGKGDVRAQTEQVMENLKAALASVGSDLRSLVKITTYLVDMSQIGALREVRMKHLAGENPPASTLVGVTALATPDFLVEIEAVAVIP